VQALKIRDATGHLNVGVPSLENSPVDHLAHDSKPDRMLQVARIREVIAAGKGPFFLMGDLNCRPDSEEYASLLAPDKDGAVDAWAKIGKGQGPTIGLDGKSPGRIDYILVSPDLAAGLETARVDTETKASDHQPLFASLRVPTRP
jgi:endonuclease/exonuclease/phosphatase family metal-dependent hydrolase